MILYPAIDLKNGSCVRLLQGRDEGAKVYSNNPVQMALHWESEGAEWLHVVDLDAAMTGESRNGPTVEAILQAVRIPVQLGGGFRTLDRVKQAIEIGASRVVIGTAAVENPEMLRQALEQFADFLAVGVDVKHGYVATRGWKEDTTEEAVTFAKKLALWGVRTLVVTDISQDGMMTGPNYALTEQIAEASRVPVILSGGISSLNDIRLARALANKGVDGIVIGRALYEKRFTLREALIAARFVQ